MSDHSDLVMLCVDGSEESRHAARVALALVGREGRRLALVTVVPDLEQAAISGIDPIAPVMPNPGLAEVTEQRRHEATQMLSQLATELQAPDADQVVLIGSAAPALREFADEQRPGLIVTGARGLNDHRHGGVGDVPDHLVRKAPCPVLVVRADAAGADAGPVIIGVDGSAHARNAAVEVVSLLPAPVPVLLVTVAAKAPAESTRETGYEMLGGRKWAAEEDAMLTEVAAAIDRPDATHAVITGRPAEALIDHASQTGARALVIGSKGHGVFARAILGSVAHTVIGGATCPVFVVGPRS